MGSLVAFAFVVEAFKRGHGDDQQVTCSCTIAQLIAAATPGGGKSRPLEEGEEEEEVRRTRHICEERQTGKAKCTRTAPHPANRRAMFESQSRTITTEDI